MSGGSKNQTVTQQTEIPDFLKPYIQQQMSAQGQSLTNLTNMLQGAGAQQMVAPLNRFQNEAAGALTQGVPNAFAAAGQGAGDAYSQAQQRIGQFQQSAGRFVDQASPMFMGGLQQAISGEFVPQVATDTLSGIAGQGFQLDPVAQQALQSTAAGQGLYGNPAFDEAVQASIRAARPSVLSTFAQGGSGAIKGGLAQTAMQQVASDAFARQYGQERANQLSAAGQLGQFGLAGQGQQIGAAGTLGQLGLGQQGLRNQALGIMGQSLDAERQRQAQANMMQANLGISGALNAGQLGIQGAQAQAQGLATVGDRLQGQRQAELTAPLNAALMMQQASSGLPLQYLLGQSTSQPIYRNTGAGLLGGAATGAQIGNMVGGPVGAGIGAIGGGLLGGFF
jgi:hypothetical protein